VADEQIQTCDEVLVSDATRHGAGRLDRVEFRRHGLRQFKNVGDLVDVYRAVRLHEEADALPIDPVCRMGVDPGQAVGSLTFGDRKYLLARLQQGLQRQPGEVHDSVTKTLGWCAWRASWSAR
jgi:hypothetical protein